MVLKFKTVPTWGGEKNYSCIVVGFEFFQFSRILQSSHSTAIISQSSFSFFFPFFFRLQNKRLKVFQAKRELCNLQQVKATTVRQSWRPSQYRMLFISKYAFHGSLFYHSFVKGTCLFIRTLKLPWNNFVFILELLMQ